MGGQPQPAGRRLKWPWIVGIAAVVILIAVLAIGAGDDDSPNATVPSGPSGDPTTVGDGSPSTTGTVAPSTVPPTAPPTSGTPPSTSGPESSETSASSSIPTTSTLPPADDPTAGEEADAPVPRGQAIELANWRIGVSGAELDATQTILDFVDFNEPPKEGSQYVLVELSGVLISGTLAQPVFDWALAGPEFDHVPAGLECGVVPDSIYDVGDVTPGDQFTANVCFEVPSADVSDDLLLTLGLVDESGRERFFALTD